VNLYLRLLWLLLRLRSLQRRGPFEESRVTFCVWPNDCDLNLHMNNGRYLTFMDLGRVQLIAQSGLLREAWRRRWMPVLAAAEITYLRSLKPFTRFDLVTRLLTWDDKYVYLEQLFERDGELCAHAYVKAVFLERGARVPNTELLQAIGHTDAAPPMSEGLQHWAAMADSKRAGIA
jgi:acyl-CoA thioesterase FadM